MSQKKVDEYKQSKATRGKESKKETSRRRLEIGILIAIVAAGIIWLAYLGISSSLSSKTETVELNTSAIDSYIYDLQYGTDDDTDETEEAEPEEETEEESEADTGEE